VERLYHRKLTVKIIDTVYPDIDRVVRNTLIRAGISIELKNFFVHRRDLYFERIPYAPHESAWEIGILELRYRLMRYTWFYKRGYILRACKEAGMLIHMIENLTCHSNLLSLPEEAAEQVIQSLISLSSYPHMEETQLQFASRDALQIFGFRHDGFIHKKTCGWFPDDNEIQFIAGVVGRFFKHYGIIVHHG